MDSLIGHEIKKRSPIKDYAQTSGLVLFYFNNHIESLMLSFPLYWLFNAVVKFVPFVVNSDEGYCHLFGITP